MPYFSVVIPVYNKEKHIGATIKSALVQSFEDFEIIIVNDGSTDKSQQIIQSYKDNRIKLITIENSGPSHARNYGVSQSKADFIAFLDADDLWLPHHLDDLKKLIERYPNCGMYAKAYKIATNKILVEGVYQNIPKGWNGILKDFFLASLRNGIASSSSVVLPKDTFNSLNGFNVNFNAGEDTDLWIRLALLYKVVFQNAPTTIINWDSNNRLSDTNIMSKSHFDLNAYTKQEFENKSLKNYLDRNRLSLAFQYKIAGHSDKSSVLLGSIAKENISFSQNALLNSPTWFLQVLLRIRNTLRRLNIDFRLFK